MSTGREWERAPGGAGGQAVRERIWAATFGAAFVAAACRTADVLNTSPCVAAEQHDFAEQAEGLADRAVEQYVRWLKEGKAR